METKMNELYEDLARRLQYALEKGVSGEAMTPIKGVIHALKQLGQRLVLENNVQQFIDITTNMAKTYAAKNHDYGNSFEQSCNKFGIIAAIVRMGDKMNRLESLAVKKAEVKDESIKDTLLDLASYSIMTVMWLDNKNKSGEKMVRETIKEV
jgi:hypothetical protein